jgi:hypothetical protein
MSAPRTQAAPNPPPPNAPPRNQILVELDKFWLRVTEGLELSQLWKQFRADAKSSYRLYRKDFDARVPEGTRRQNFFHTAQEFTWALLEKLTPARRVLLLAGVVLLLLPTGNFSYEGKSGVQAIEFDFHFFGGLVLLLLLLLEVADRVVMKRDLEIARDIQSWLLPASPPNVPGVAIAFATRPANTVAGDFYDVFPRAGTESRFLMAVADVAGKSIPAALLMATFQASLKTLSETPCSLLELVAGMNRYACSNSQSGLRFTTAFLAEYDPASRALSYVNAGHNTPVVLRSAGGLERLEAGGLPLGILADAAYQSGSLTLQPGDWLVVFTDGLVEAVNSQDEEYGEQRMMTVLNSGVRVTPDEMLRRLMNDLDAFVGPTAQHDDVTCLLVKVI